jgi:hypothetical protein
VTKQPNVKQSKHLDIPNNPISTGPGGHTETKFWQEGGAGSVLDSFDSRILSEKH